MTILSVSAARQNLSTLINQVAEGHKPIFIKGKHKNAVLISEDELSGLQETLYLMSIPGLWESIVEGANIPLSECVPLDKVLKL